MAQCKRCGYISAKNSIFCDKCGSKLDVIIEAESVELNPTCKKCGEELPYGSVFCNVCGYDQRKKLKPKKENKAKEEEVHDDDYYADLENPNRNGMKPDSRAGMGYGIGSICVGYIPFISIIAIFLGLKGKKISNKYNDRLGKIFSIFALVESTLFTALYFFILIWIISLTMLGLSVGGVI